MKKLLALSGGLMLLAGAAMAQAPVSIVGPTDLFQDAVGGVGTVPSYFATAGQIGDTASVSYSVPLTAFSITAANGVYWTVINPAGTLATGTFTMAPNPVNGSRSCFLSTQSQTAVTFTANTGQTIVNGPGSTAMATASTPVCFTYIAPIASWVKG